MGGALNLRDIGDIRLIFIVPAKPAGSNPNGLRDAFIVLEGAGNERRYLKLRRGNEMVVGDDGGELPFTWMS